MAIVSAESTLPLERRLTAVIWVWGATAALAALSSFAISHLVNLIARKFGLLHSPGTARVHSIAVVRLGGVAILPSFLIAWALTGTGVGPSTGVVVGAIGATTVGLVDDLRGMRPTAKLAGQFAVAIAATTLGVRIVSVSNPLGGAIELNELFGASLTVFWLVGMMNAVNLLDGLDGLAPGVILVAAAILSVLSFQLGASGLVVFGASLAGAIAGFLPLNAYRARLILGDSGSHLIGFLIGSLAVLGQAKIGTTLLVLGIPILDLAWTVVRRKRSGKSITSRDTDHLHHKLLQIGLSTNQVSIAYVALCAAFGGAALLLDSTQKIFGLVALTGLTVALLYLGATKSSTD